MRRHCVKFRNPNKSQYRQLLKKTKAGEIIVVPMDDRLTESAPPYVATGRTQPDWFKDAPKNGIRKCAGVQDYLNLGVVIRAWTDFHFEPRPELGGWEVDIAQMPLSVDPFISDPFPRTATGTCPMTDARKQDESPYPKLVNPYAFITAKGWSLMITEIPYEPNPNYTVIPAIVNTDYYHHVNIVLNLTNDQPFTIKHGEPIARLIPFKRSGDITKLNFASDSMFRFVVGRGLGPNQIKDSGGIARAYRRALRQSVDNES